MMIITGIAFIEVTGNAGGQVKCPFCDLVLTNQPSIVCYYNFPGIHDGESHRYICVECVSKKLLPVVRHKHGKNK